MYISFKSKKRDSILKVNDIEYCKMKNSDKGKRLILYASCEEKDKFILDRNKPKPFEILTSNFYNISFALIDKEYKCIPYSIKENNEYECYFDRGDRGSIDFEGVCGKVIDNFLYEGNNNLILVYQYFKRTFYETNIKLEIEEDRICFYELSCSLSILRTKANGEIAEKYRIVHNSGGKQFDFYSFELRMNNCELKVHLGYSGFYCYCSKYERIFNKNKNIFDHFKNENYTKYVAPNFKAGWIEEIEGLSFDEFKEMLRIWLKYNLIIEMKL